MGREDISETIVNRSCDDHTNAITFRRHDLWDRVVGNATWKAMYRMVQQNFTPEIEVFYMLFDRSLSIFSMTSLKQHMEYFNCRYQIQLDHLVVIYVIKGDDCRMLIHSYSTLFN